MFNVTEKANLLYTMSVKLENNPFISPVSCSFGSDSGSDQFSLYVVYSSGVIAIQKILHLPRYVLTKNAMKTLNSRDPSLLPWFSTWEKIDEDVYEYTIPEGFAPQSEFKIIYNPSKPLSLSSATLSLYSMFISFSVSQPIEENSVAVFLLLNDSQISVFLHVLDEPLSPSVFFCPKFEG